MVAAELDRCAAMVLAAGLGTRLRPLTDELPKPLCPIGDRAPIDGILTSLAREGFARAVVNTHHLHEAFDDAWRAAQALDVQLSHETEVLGTGGGIANAGPLLGEGPVIVWNADILATPELAALARGAEGAVSARLMVAPVAPGEPGTVGLSREGRVVRMRGQRYGEEVAQADYIGIAWLSAKLRARLPIPGCLAGDGYMPALRDGEVIDTLEHTSGFTDIGSIASYLQANLAWLAAAGWTSLVHPSAHVERSVRVTHSVVGRGARVEGEGELKECVVWPGARAVAPLQRCVVTRRGVVQGGG